MLPLIIAGAALGAYSSYQGSVAEEKKMRDERAKLKRQQDYTAEVARKQEAIAERNRAIGAKDLNSGSRSAAIANFQSESAANAQASSGGVASGSSMGASLAQRFQEADRSLADSFSSGVEGLNVAGSQIDLNNRQAEMNIDMMQYDVDSLSDQISSVSNPLNRLTDMALGAYSGGQAGFALGSGLDTLMQEPGVQRLVTGAKQKYGQTKNNLKFASGGYAGLGSYSVMSQGKVSGFGTDYSGYR